MRTALCCPEPPDRPATGDGYSTGPRVVTVVWSPRWQGAREPATSSTATAAYTARLTHR